MGGIAVPPPLSGWRPIREALQRSKARHRIERIAAHLLPRPGGLNASVMTMVPDLSSWRVSKSGIARTGEHAK